MAKGSTTITIRVNNNMKDALLRCAAAFHRLIEKMEEQERLIQEAIEATNQLDAALTDEEQEL